MTVTTEMMQDFATQYDVLGRLTEELTKRQDSHPDIPRYVGWHPAYFYKKLMEELPREATVLIEKDDFFDGSFIKELGKLNGALWVMESDYPALVNIENGEHLSILTVDFCKEMFHKIENNANAVRELADLLKKHGHELWFSTPDKVAPTKDSKLQALAEALFNLTQEKPKKFKTQVKAKLYTLGFDESALSNKEIDALLGSLLFDE
jgi:hypothetical protein